MKAYERLLKYVVVRTPSDENSDTVPSSQCQFDLARILEQEMKPTSACPMFIWMTSVIFTENFRLLQGLRINRQSDLLRTWILLQISATMTSLR